MYEIFKKQWNSSFDCKHETLSKDVNVAKYRVGHLKGKKENWKCVEYRVTSTFDASCSCAKFEGYGILCKHILYIMKRKQVKSIPSHYILPRWTMNVRYDVGSIGFGRKESEEVSFLMLWFIRSNLVKHLKNGKIPHLKLRNLIHSLKAFLKSKIEERRFKPIWFII